MANGHTPLPTVTDRQLGNVPHVQMRRLVAKRIAQAGLTVELVGVSAERIPRDDASLDWVVTTYTLCSIPDPAAALREMRRVLRPQGHLLLRARRRAG
jgi:ubiquinone/menaquinone biosynthesis C-methylase UbiE